MPFDSNGNYTLPTSYFVENGDTVLPIQHNPPFEDVAQALSLAFLRDGRSPMIGDLPMGSKRIINLAPGVAAADAVTKAQLDALSPTPPETWAMQPIGALIAANIGATGFSAPPKDKEYRYILLSAGQTGSGAYNQGVLTSESVSGSSPNTSATAIVSLSGSPFNGQIVRLINTERRFLRPGSPGTLENSDNLSHAHGVNDGGHNHGVNDPGHSHQILTRITPDGGTGGQTIPAGGVTSSTLRDNGTAQAGGSGTGIWLNGSGANVSIQASGGSEARPRNIGVDFYMRIK